MMGQKKEFADRSQFDAGPVPENAAALGLEFSVVY